MKLSHVFKEAKQIVGNQRFPYICLAIKDIKDAPQIDIKRALEVIRNRIMPDMPAYYQKNNYPQYCCALESWLESVQGIYVYAAPGGSMKAYRLRWLDALIAEFEAKGDWWLNKNL